MLKTRIIPCLQLIDQSLVKTVQFKTYNYIGDPINTVNIFNDLEVDELCFLDIRASIENREPNFKILHQIANECFMPLSYGGGIKDFDTVKKVLSIGFEKVVLNTYAFRNKELIRKISDHFGAQSLIVSIDVKKNIFGKYAVHINDGSEKINISAIDWALEVENLGAGELLITSMNNDGTWSGFDIDITKKISESVSIPVIANGGAGCLNDITEIIKKGKADAVALGSMVVYQKKDMGVLINFPDKNELEKALESNL